MLVNDLPSVVKNCSVNLYADNTSIYASDANPSTVGHQFKENLGSIATMYINTNDESGKNTVYGVVWKKQTEESSVDW